jgi:hypothetical protein
MNMSKDRSSGNAVIHRLGQTKDRLTGRAGLALFSRYLRGVGILPELGRVFGSVRKNAKGLPAAELFQQALCFFFDGPSRQLVHFDALKADAGYAGAIETVPERLASSHTMKRFFGAFRGPQNWGFRRVLQQLFLWRLQQTRPKVIVLGIDAMVMDNDEAKKRHGVEPTYKNVCGFAPLQITWERYLIDTVFRGGKKHSNADESVANAVRRLVSRIRKHYRAGVPIVVRMDSGFFDQALFALFEELGIGYVVGGRLSAAVVEVARQGDTSLWGSYRNQRQEWQYLEFGHRCGNWKRLRRFLYTRPVYEDEQRLLEFARPDTVLVTNLGRGERIDALLKAAGHGDWVEPQRILELYHQRGADELVFRALKDFASETLPFQSFSANSAFYHTMLLAFFLFESFKEDVAAPVVPVTAYATRVRRTLVDFAGKLVRTGGRVILKVTQATFQQLRLDALWAHSASPPRFVWVT